MTEKERFDIFMAAVLNNLNTASELLNKEPDLITVRNGIGETVFHFLVVENCIKEIIWLLDKGSDINTQNEFGDTPLLEAAGLGYLELCKILVERGADPKIRSELGETALSEAAINSELDVVNFLLELVGSNEYLDDSFNEIDFNILLEGNECAKALEGQGLQWSSELTKK